jgi:hypothetical protein
MPTVKTTINSAVMLLRGHYEMIAILQHALSSGGAASLAKHIGLSFRETPDDSVAASVLDEFDCSLTYVLNRRAADQLAESIGTQLSEQLGRSGIPPMESRVLTSGTDTSQILETIERVDRIDKGQTDPSKRIRSLVATSLVSHGVDLSRLNWMMFYGMPFLVAEYIQAGSRVGRRAVGIVVTVFAPNNERDRGVYHRFAEFHRHVDALVEPSAVERELPKAFFRTVPGLLAALALQERSRRVLQPAYVAEVFARLAMLPEYSNELTAQRVLELAGLSDRADDASVEAVRKRTSYICEQIEMTSLMGDAGSKRKPVSEGNGWKAMTSLRDVDEEVWFEAVSDTVRVFSQVDERINATRGTIGDEGEE